MERIRYSVEVPPTPNWYPTVAGEKVMRVQMLAVPSILMLPANFPEVTMRIPMLFAMPLLLLTPSPTMQTAMYDGKPAFAEGVELGYYVWRDGDTWHVRWTTMGRMRNFAGSVSATGGKLKSLKRIDVETERKVLYPGRPAHVVRGPRGRVRGVRGGRAPVVATREQDHIEMDGNSRIVFNARTDNDIDGFSFKVDDVEHLQFNLGIDGRPAPNLIEVGHNNEKPKQLPLILTLK